MAYFQLFKYASRDLNEMTDATVTGDLVTADATTPRDSASVILPLPPGMAPRQKFGKLEALHRSHNDRSKRIMIHCLCECGTQCDVRLSDLRLEHTKSCGCRRAATIRKNLGTLFLKKIGNVTVLGNLIEKGVKPQLSTEWLVACGFCHRLYKATGSQIRRRAKHCSCLDLTYNSWRNMRQRCGNKNLAQFRDYGGRGITCHEPWKNFADFVKDMGQRPEGTTLDRIDFHGSYDPKNCRWADASTQAQNRRKRASSTDSPVAD